MRANNKTVVMARITKDRKSRIIPVAVFARREQAAPFGRLLRDAVKAGNEVDITGLTIGTGIPGAEWVGADVVLSVATLPYCPTVDVPADDPFAEESSAAS